MLKAIPALSPSLCDSALRSLLCVTLRSQLALRSQGGPAPRGADLAAGTGKAFSLVLELSLHRPASLSIFTPTCGTNSGYSEQN